MTWCSNRTFKQCDGKKTVEGFGADTVTRCEHGCSFSHDSKDDQTLKSIGAR